MVPLGVDDHVLLPLEQPEADADSDELTLEETLGDRVIERVIEGETDEELDSVPECDGEKLPLCVPETDRVPLLLPDGDGVAETEADGETVCDWVSEFVEDTVPHGEVDHVSLPLAQLEAE